MRVRKDTLSIRVPTELTDKIDADIADGLYKSVTHAVVSLVTDGYSLRDLMEIAKNPELQQEMDEKIKSMIGNSNVEQTLETMSIKERNSIIFYARTLNEKALTQVKFN